MSIEDKIDKYLGEGKIEQDKKRILTSVGKKFTFDGNEYIITGYQRSNYPVLAKRVDNVKYPSKFKSARKEWEFTMKVAGIKK